MNINNSFKVAGLGYDLSTVKKITKKCIFRFKNHYEIIQLHSLRIPDVNIIFELPWIEKHCLINYHDSKKITFSSRYCTQHCNVGKRNRKIKNKKKYNKISTKGKEPYEELSVTKKEINPKSKYSFESDSDMNSDEEVTIRGRRTRVKTCNEIEEINDLKNFCIINYDSDVNDSFMFDSNDEIYEFSDSNNINLDELNKICKIDVLSNNVTKNYNYNDYLNKDENKKYISKKCSLKNLCCIYNCLNISNFENELNQKIIGIPLIYKNYAVVFNERNCDVLPPHCEYYCEIRLKDNSNLFYGPIYPLTEVERDELKKYIKENLEKGFIRKSTSPAGAPILFVKKDGSLRLSVNYRKLNEMTIRNSCPLPLISKLLDRVKVISFGLKNTPVTFQHFINDVLSDYLDDFVILYIDDILIYSNGLEEHHIHVKKDLKKLLENNLYVKFEK
eukprot:jgi/Orpsp1_1/1183886/evm.model.c7180000087119.1